MVINEKIQKSQRNQQVFPILVDTIIAIMQSTMLLKIEIIPHVAKLTDPHNATPLVARTAPNRKKRMIIFSVPLLHIIFNSPDYIITPLIINFFHQIGKKAIEES